jgi:hypothetical protein
MRETEIADRIRRLTDPDLLAKKLALVETCVADVRRLAHPEDIGHDLREERFVELLRTRLQQLGPAPQV